jgi:hypothetical protein
MSRELDELTDDLIEARDDKDEKKAVEAKLRPLLTSLSVNSVDDIGRPLVSWIARESPSLLPVALELKQDPDIISMSLHYAIRWPSTTPASVGLLI